MGFKDVLELRTQVSEIRDCLAEREAERCLD